ncbi:unnamed protein product [Darwinula stevensoni]|uniref:BZIP domain-containing protein n=1 Tax=Darwinula stevensoni TaxID=69355 RepID=A0A7R9A4G9_9CRUS|nr:unnamed protein product [Darwinula stevensoni]CAG0883332.1 unnamed protein product [Darwinula stevensoni]
MDRKYREETILIHSSYQTETEQTTSHVITGVAFEVVSGNGLNSGVPTQTTPTLTPTTLRNIEQSLTGALLELQNLPEPSPHSSQAGFVPPPVQPASQTLSKTAGGDSVITTLDSKSWQGGSTLIVKSEPTCRPSPSITPISSSSCSSPPPTMAPMQNSKASKNTPRKTGGRKPTRNEKLTPEEEARRHMRRERNKQAAARCRKRRLDHTNALLKETEGLEDKKMCLQNEIKLLQSQKEELEFLLQAHRSNCKLLRRNARCNADASGDKEGRKENKPLDCSTEKPQRPNSLPFRTSNMKNVTELAGVPIVTPSSGMTFTFDSFVESGTGLTPLTTTVTPLTTTITSDSLNTPSDATCGNQQRSSGPEVTSMESNPPKLWLPSLSAIRKSGEIKQFLLSFTHSASIVNDSDTKVCRDSRQVGADCGNKSAEISNIRLNFTFDPGPRERKTKDTLSVRYKEVGLMDSSEAHGLPVDTFHFHWKTEEGIEVSKNIPIPRPLFSMAEWAALLVKEYNLPGYVQPKLESALLRQAQDILKQEKCAEGDEILQSNLDIQKIAEKWQRAYEQECEEYSKREKATDEEVFADIYHSLIHSRGSLALLRREHSCAQATAQLIQRRDKDLEQLSRKQSDEMEEMMRGEGNDEAEVNALAEKHHFTLEMAQSQWASRLCALEASERKEFAAWLVAVHESMHMENEQTVKKLFEQLSKDFDPEEDLDDEKHKDKGSEVRQESFTVHLGAQMKQTHNLRILASDALAPCRRYYKVESEGVPDPIRMQTALSLYSNSLHGFVVLVDNRISSYSGWKKEFASICEQSPELHFPLLEEQLEAVRQVVKENTSSSNGHCLSVGDVYVTRHSNLSEVHVVFHLVVDEGVIEMSSRHPVILGLRNILKVASLCDITTVTVPLLLAHSITEEMTIPWCMKRSELVLKCLKGFLMEMASWGGSHISTLQFVVPKLCGQSVAERRQFRPLVFHSLLTHRGGGIKEEPSDARIQAMAYGKAWEYTLMGDPQGKKLESCLAGFEEQPGGAKTKILHFLLLLSQPVPVDKHLPIQARKSIGDLYLLFNQICLNFVTAHSNEHKATVENQEELVSRESENRLLTECPDVEVHSLRALAVRPLLILASSPAPVTEVCFTSEELLQYSLDALQGIPSSLFCLNQTECELHLLDGASCAGVTAETLHPILEDFASTGSCVIRLRESPVEGVRQILQMLLLPLSQGASDVSSILDLHERTVYLRKQILFLSHCVPSSESLSISLLLQVSNVASLNENLILAHLLSVAISPLSKCMQGWVFQGNPSGLIVKDECGDKSWFHSFSIAEPWRESIPEELRDQVVRVGRDLLLLHLAGSQEQGIDMWMEGHPPFDFCRMEEECSEVMRKCERFRKKCEEALDAFEQDLKDQAEKCKAIRLQEREARRRIRLQLALSQIREAQEQKERRNAQKKRLWEELQEQAAEKQRFREHAAFLEEAESLHINEVQRMMEEKQRKREALVREELERHYERLSTEAVERQQKAEWRLARITGHTRGLQDHLADLSTSDENANPRDPSEVSVAPQAIQKDQLNANIALDGVDLNANPPPTVDENQNQFSQVDGVQQANESERILVHHAVLLESPERTEKSPSSEKMVTGKCPENQPLSTPCGRKKPLVAESLKESLKRYRGGQQDKDRVDSDPYTPFPSQFLIPAIERAKEQNEKKRFILKLQEDRRMPQMPLKNLFLQSLHLPLHTQERLVNCAVWILLKEKLHLLEHLDAVQHFFFLHDEGYARSLALHFLDSMERVDETPLSTYECHLALSSAIESSFPARLKALHQMYLDYDVGWPLKILFDEGSLRSYNSIMVLLLQVKISSYALQRVFLSLRKSDMKGSKTHMMRSHMVHFVQSVEEYLHGRISFLWKEFQGRIKDMGKSQSLEDLYQIHWDFLAKSLRLCLLDGEDGNGQLRKRLVEGLEAVVSFSSLACQSLVSHSQAESIQVLYDVFLSHVLPLFLTLKEVCGGETAEESGILLALDLSGFYTRTCVGRT